LLLGNTGLLLLLLHVSNIELLLGSSAALALLLLLCSLLDKSSH
jgi:hypothetical protein